MDVYKAVTHWGSGNVWEPIGTNLGTNLNVVLKAIVFRNILGITFFFVSRLSSAVAHCDEYLSAH